MYHKEAFCTISKSPDVSQNEIIFFGETILIISLIKKCLFLLFANTSNSQLKNHCLSYLEYVQNQISKLYLLAKAQTNSIGLHDMKIILYHNDCN
jgi:hypothetical protein